MTDHLQLSRREREIMDVVYRLTEASVRDVLDHLSDPPSDSAVRTMLARLEEKGHVHRTQRGRHQVFLPTTPRHHARGAAVSRLLATFFDGSVEAAVSALLDKPNQLDRAELDRIAELIEQRRKESDR